MGLGVGLAIRYEALGETMAPKWLEINFRQPFLRIHSFISIHLSISPAIHLSGALRSTI